MTVACKKTVTENITSLDFADTLYVHI